MNENSINPSPEFHKIPLSTLGDVDINWKNGRVTAQVESTLWYTASTWTKGIHKKYSFSTTGFSV
jgi:hypothetical protein